MYVPNSFKPNNLKVKDLLKKPKTLGKIIRVSDYKRIRYFNHSNWIIDYKWDDKKSGKWVLSEKEPGEVTWYDHPYLDESAKNAINGILFPLIVHLSLKGEDYYLDTDNLKTILNRIATEIQEEDIRFVNTLNDEGPSFSPLKTSFYQKGNLIIKLEEYKELVRFDDQR